MTTHDRAPRATARARALGRTAIALFRRARSSSIISNHVLIVLVFFGTRVALYIAGLRFNLELRWMFLSDLRDLRERLFETLYYFHAFGPGMNLITGVLLKISPAHLATTATAVFWLFGAVLTVSLYRILKLLGCGRWKAMAVALAFSLLPQTLYLENLYLYTYLCASLLCLSAVLFQRALGKKSVLAWLWFFLICAALGWLYTVFHLLWFGVMAGSRSCFRGPARGTRSSWARRCRRCSSRASTRKTILCLASLAQPRGVGAISLFSPPNR